MYIYILFIIYFIWRERKGEREGKEEKERKRERESYEDPAGRYPYLGKEERSQKKPTLLTS